MDKKFEYVIVKTKTGEHRVLFTKDKKYFRAVDMIRALGNKFIYSIQKTLDENGINIKLESKTTEGNRVYSFLSVEGVLKIEELLDGMYPVDSAGRRTFPEDKKGYFESQLIALRDYKQAMTESGLLKDTQESGVASKGATKKADSPIDVIMEELIKLSQEIDNKPRMVELQELSKELSETKKLLADKTKEVSELTKQLSMSEAKFQELKIVNLDLVKQRDALEKETKEMANLKKVLESMFKGK